VCVRGGRVGDGGIGSKELASYCSDCITLNLVNKQRTLFQRDWQADVTYKKTASRADRAYILEGILLQQTYS
jgi:hypothetical protein